MQQVHHVWGSKLLKTWAETFSTYCCLYFEFEQTLVIWQLWVGRVWQLEVMVQPVLAEEKNNDGKTFSFGFKKYVEKNIQKIWITSFTNWLLASLSTGIVNIRWYCLYCSELAGWYYMFGWLWFKWYCLNFHQLGDSHFREIHLFSDADFAIGIARCNWDAGGGPKDKPVPTKSIQWACRFYIEEPF